MVKVMLDILFRDGMLTEDEYLRALEELHRREAEKKSA
jgi:uncharacterized protein YqgQ